MIHKHDPIRHLSYLRQSLSQDNEAIGFFISAGCPLAVPMPSDKWPLIPDVKNLTIAINAVLAADNEYSCLLRELEKSGKSRENIEDVLSFLRSLLAVSKGGEVRGLTEGDLNKLEKKICDEIVKKLDVVHPNDETPYHSLCKWVGSIDRKIAIEIFTTNYDLLLEQALEELEVPYFDGFVGSCKSFFDLRAVEDNMIPEHWSRLWKIHGSINWHQEQKGDERVVWRSSSPKDGASHLIYPSHLKYEESRKMPYLALIDQLNRFIRRKSSFLILNGYSFNDGHLNDAIVNALKSNPTGMVLALQYGSYEKSEKEGGGERYPNANRLAKRQHNLNVWTDDKAIIGTNLGDWGKARSTEAVDTDLLSFVNAVTVEGGGGATVSHVKLGDFLEFTNFLKKFIGLDVGDQLEK
ncbi:SIR2 family protein [Cohaesibacter celericrescens]|uniref:SIR2 family protein n=1 Tax=Cohaesibacter celericrescens TaxID=2067669 RepID=A0A2N5XQE2_9HYPH|nr:SIR2 family protein [Cohaesibacter celericrescens]